MHHFTTLALVLSAAFTAAASVPLRRETGVCGPLSTPLCCQLDVEGVANSNCENGTYALSPFRLHLAPFALYFPFTIPSPWPQSSVEYILV
jgi:hypothetical protein